MILSFSRCDIGAAVLLCKVTPDPSLPQSQMIVLVFVGNDTEIYHTHIWQSLPHYAIQYTASIRELFISELMTLYLHCYQQLK